MFGSRIRPSPDPFFYPNTRMAQVAREGDRHQWAPDTLGLLELSSSPPLAPLEPCPVVALSILSVAAQPSQTARPQQNSGKRKFDGKNHPQVMLDYQDHH